jgi:hypothetical protein
MLRTAASAFVLALIAAGSSSAGLVARGVHDGLLALGAGGVPNVAYVRGTSAEIATRLAGGGWRAARLMKVPARAEVVAFKVGSRGPVALVESADLKKLWLVRRAGRGWQAIRIGRALPARVQLGLPGLCFAANGTPLVAYTRWSNITLDSRLLLARVDARGRVVTKQVTREGFPKSAVPPPAAPVLVNGRAHVVESYGYRGVVGTIEWYPDRNTWTGLFIDAGVGDYPVGPVLAGLSPAGTLFAAWTESLNWFDAVPVTLAMHAKEMSSRVVLDRALTTALALPQSGPEIAANEWVGSGQLGFGGDSAAWAGTIVRRRTKVELDGWIAGYSVSPGGGRDLLLAGPAGLSWFRAPGMPSVRVNVEATDNFDGSVRISGRVRGAASGRVEIFRERPGFGRQLAGRAALSGGAFSFVDRPPARPVLYRAVYTDPVTAVPYAALLRSPIY